MAPDQNCRWGVPTFRLESSAHNAIAPTGVYITSSVFGKPDYCHCGRRTSSVLPFPASGERDRSRFASHTGGLGLIRQDQSITGRLSAPESRSGLAGRLRSELIRRELNARSEAGIRKPCARHRRGAYNSCESSVRADISGRQSNAPRSPMRIDVQHEQDFFRAHYDMLSRDAHKAGARPSLQARAGAALSPGSPDATLEAASRFFGNIAAGVVGPMSSGGLSLPSVEKVLDREAPTPTLEAAGASSSARSAGLARRVCHYPQH